jgi:hypothetical protein
LCLDLAGCPHWRMKGYDPTKVMMWYLKDEDKLQSFIEMQQVLAAYCSLCRLH